MNIPTCITVSRLLGLPFLFYLLQEPTPVAQWWAVIIFLICGATDWVDGYLARKWNQVTELGKFLDPLVDKLLVLAPLLILVGWGRIPAWGVFLILGREFAISGWRVNPQLAGRSQIAGASLWGKLKTASQIGAIALLMAPLSAPWTHLAQILFWIAVGLTLQSGAIYILPYREKPVTQSAIE